MRNLKISMLCSVFMLLLAFGCQKESSPIQEELSPAIQTTTEREACSDMFAFETNEIMVTEGRFHFPNYLTLLKTVASLECAMEDRALNDSASIVLQLPEDSTFLVPEVPILELFNNSYPEVNSLRQRYDVVEHQIDMGEAEEDAIDDVLFWDPALGSIINIDNEVQVGDFIYKYLDDFQTLIYSVEDSVRKKVEDCPNLLEIENSYNLFRIDNRREMDIDFYEKFEDMNRGGNCDIAITWTNQGASYEFKVVGMFPQPSGNHPFIWHIRDGNGATLASSNIFSNTFNFNVPQNVTLPLMVAVLVDESCEAEEIFIHAPPPPPLDYDCSSLNFGFTLIDPTTIRFIIAPNTPALSWTFNGSNDFNSAQTGANGGSFIYSVPDDVPVPFVVCATVNTPDCSNTVCRTISNVGCGSITSFRRKHKVEYWVGFNAVKYKFQLRNPLWDVSSIVAKNKHYIVNGAIKTRTKADMISVALNSSNPGIGDLIWYDRDCGQRVQIAVYSEASSSGFVRKRKLVKHAKMRQGDDRAFFSTRETLTPASAVPAGIPNPFTYTRTL